MAQKEKVAMPATGGGLFRPTDEEGTGLKIKPEYIIIMSIIAIIAEIVLHLYGPVIF